MLLGEPYHTFWDLTPREYKLVARAIVKREEGEMLRRRILQQEMAYLIGYAYHEPQKIPDFTKERGAAEPDPEKQASENRAAMLAFMNAHNAAISGKSKMVKR